MLETAKERTELLKKGIKPETIEKLYLNGNGFTVYGFGKNGVGIGSGKH